MQRPYRSRELGCGKDRCAAADRHSGVKHAVVGYFDALRAEVEIAYGIRVRVILPGAIHTPIAVSALSGDGTPRGQSDAHIDTGMDVNDAAQRMLAGLIEGRREIVVAEG